MWVLNPTAAAGRRVGRANGSAACQRGLSTAEAPRAGQAAEPSTTPHPSVAHKLAEARTLCTDWFETCAHVRFRSPRSHSGHTRQAAECAHAAAPCCQRPSAVVAQCRGGPVPRRPVPRRPSAVVAQCRGGPVPWWPSAVVAQCRGGPVPHLSSACAVALSSPHHSTCAGLCAQPPPAIFGAGADTERRRVEYSGVLLPPDATANLSFLTDGVEVSAARVARWMNGMDPPTRCSISLRPMPVTLRPRTCRARPRPSVHPGRA